MKTSLSVYAIVVVLFTATMFTQPTNPLQFNKPSNVGTEFYFSVPPCYEVGGTSAINLYVACPVKTKVTVDVEGRGFSVVRQTVANDIIEIRLNPGVAQAFSKTDSEGIPAEQVWPKAAVHVKADVPITVYVSIRFPYTSDTFLALPVESLGKEYIVASMADMTWMYGGYSLPSITTITAIEDSTIVNFKLGGNAVTVTSGGLKSGQTKTFTMNRGDVVVIGNSKDSKEGDMSGSKITSDKPIAVTSGNQCANVPTTLRWCDYIAEMELPTQMWGKTLLVPRFSTRKNSALIKVFAKDSNTMVSKNCSAGKLIQKAGGVEGTGFMYERVNANANTVMVYSADSPISATFFNSGQEDDNVVSDPFQMNIYPVEQFSTSYIINTPGIKGGFKFDFNYLNVIYQLTDNNTMPEDLEFGTAVNGEIKWRKLREMFGPSIGDVFSCLVNGKKYASKECIVPGDNVYMIRCGTPIGLYMYGVSNYDSYGHLAGAFTFDLNKKGDTQKPIPLIITSDKHKVTGSVTDIPSDSATRSNLSKIVLGITSTNCTVVHDNLKPGNVATANWSVIQTDSTKDASATLTFTDRAGNDTTITLLFTVTMAKPIITTSATGYCEGDLAVLNVSGYYPRYKWSTGDTTKQITIANVAPGTHMYSVTVYNSIGDSSVSDNFALVVNAKPTKPTIVRTGNTLSIDTVAGAIYQWFYRGGTQVKGATKSSLAVPVDGEVWSVAITVNGCTTISDAFSVPSLVGVSETDENTAILTTPNPVSAMCTVQYVAEQPSVLRVVSLNGTEVLQQTIPETGNIKRTIEMSGLAQGTYFIKITSGTREIVKKIVKE
ncbi:MAG: T9SS type A sorting domain-containing protein [Bacteriodetes bacterium]|nr:T9SS type A sorting domain-containing protein [Bacteroidota bacterium]